MKNFDKKTKGASKVTKTTWNIGKGAAKKLGAYNKRTKLFYIPKL